MFQYPLFRIELLSDPGSEHAIPHQAVSISALSDRIAQRRSRSVAPALCCFNIRSFGSNCSAQSALWPASTMVRFQYPLFRIELLSNPVPRRLCPLTQFQYPLFRIELLSAECFQPVQLRPASFNIRSFGSNCSADSPRRHPPRHRCFNIRSFGSNCSAM